MNKLTQAKINNINYNIFDLYYLKKIKIVNIYIANSVNTIYNLKSIIVFRYNTFL